MILKSPTNLSVQEEKILKAFSCIDTKSQTRNLRKVLIRQALLLLATKSDCKILKGFAPIQSQKVLIEIYFKEALGYRLTDSITSFIGQFILSSTLRNDRIILIPT